MTFTDLPDKVKHEFIDLATTLSPENLSCDGELSRSKIESRFRSLMSQWRRLERNNNIQVTEDEVWNWWTDTNGRS